MTPDRIRAIRRGLGLSQRQLGEAIGLEGVNPGERVRKWEAGEKITGPAVRLLEYYAQGMPATVQALGLPKYVVGSAGPIRSSDEDTASRYIVRLMRPRCVLQANRVVQWIDTPDEGDAARVIDEARAFMAAQLRLAAPE